MLSFTTQIFYGVLIVLFVVTFGYCPKAKTIKKRPPENHAETEALADLGSEKNHKKTLVGNYTLTGGLNSVQGRFEAFGAIPKGKSVIFT